MTDVVTVQSGMSIPRDEVERARETMHRYHLVLAGRVAEFMVGWRSEHPEVTQAITQLISNGSCALRVLVESGRSAHMSEPSRELPLEVLINERVLAGEALQAKVIHFCPGDEEVDLLKTYASQPHSHIVQVERAA